METGAKGACIILKVGMALLYAEVGRWISVF